MKIFSNFSDKLFWLVIAVGFIFLFTIPSSEKNAKFKRLSKHVFPELMYPYSLPQLKFVFNDLEPFTDAQTVNIHYTKHHQGYVDNLNSILEKYPEWQNYTLEDLLANLNALPEKLSIVIQANGGGHFNHTLFWRTLCKKGSEPEGAVPSGVILEKINGAFGSFERFKQDFLDKALSIVGSGWVWLCVDKSGEFKILATFNHEIPFSQSLKPILILDVWEHAYYLKYQNKRADFVDAWWNLIDWKEVEKIYNIVI